VQSLVLVTFIGVLAIVFGLYWVVIVRAEKHSTSMVQKRLKRSGAAAASRRLGLEKLAPDLSKVRGLNRVLLRATALTAPLQKLIEQSDSKLTVGLFVLMSGTACLAGYAIPALITGLRGIGLLVGAIALFGPFFYLRWKRSRRLLLFEEKFPEAIDLIARALRAGHAFTTGLGMVSDEVPDPVGAEFKLLYDRQNFGMPLADALRSFAERIPILDARFFATAVLTQREAGGNLSEVLDNLARVVRERFKVKRQVRVVSAHARMTGFALVGLPPVTAVAMMSVAPDNAKLLISDPLGIKMIIAAIVLQITGGLIVKKMVNIEY
jgi:tight adherence protein B